MSDASYSAQTIEIPNPLVPYARAALATGAIAALASGWCLARIQPVVSNLVLSGQLGASRSGALLLFGSACVLWLGWGLYAVVTGVRLMGPRLVAAPRTPVDLPNVDAVEQVLVLQLFPALRIPAKSSVLWMQRFLRNRVLYFTPRERVLLEQSLSWVTSALALLALALLVVFVALPRLQGDLLSGALGPLLWIAFAIVMAGAVRGLAIPMLVPKAAPGADRDENTRTVRGGGDPASLQPMFLQEFLRLREGETPNRHDRKFEARHGTVSDTGAYKARMYVETQPLSEPIGKSPLTWLYLGSGAAYWMVGLLFAVSGLMSGRVSTLTANTWIALFWTQIGRGLLASGQLHLNRLRFSSTVAFLDAEGSIGRSEIKAGKGWNDSFESANLVVRSDSTMRLYTASLTTETSAFHDRRLPDLRFIVRAERSPKSELAMRTANKCVDDYERAGIIVRPIEASDPGLNQLAQANLVFRQAAATAGAEASSAPALGASGPASPGFQLPAGPAAPASAPSEDTRTCPMCAETIKAAARKCRFCGHLFEG